MCGGFYMGYTHDWIFVKSVTEDEIDSVTPLIENVVKRHRRVIRPVQGCCRGDIFYEERSKDPYETFRVNLNEARYIKYKEFPYQPYHCWCKTARRPYDIAVCEMLLVLAAEVPGFRFSSDGFDLRCTKRQCDERGLDESWPQAIANVNKLYKLNYEADYVELNDATYFNVTENGRSVLFDFNRNRTLTSILWQQVKPKRKCRKLADI
jgi:hypothetical protein